MPTRDLQACLRDLQSDDIATQEEALRGLVRNGGLPALQEVLRTLQRPFSVLRRPAAEALMRFEGAAAAAAVAQALSSASLGVRLALLEALRQHVLSATSPSRPPTGWLRLVTLPSESEQRPVRAVIRALLSNSEDEDEDIRGLAAAVLQPMRELVRRSPRPAVRRVVEDDDDGWSGSVIPATPEPVSDLDQEIAEAVREAGRKRAGEGRCVDLAVYRDEGPAGEELVLLAGDEAMVTGAWYVLRVGIRAEARRIPFEGARPEPIRSTGASMEVELLVAAEPDGFEVREHVQTLLLPPAGDSTRDACFRIRPLELVGRPGRGSIRLRLYYELNLLESVVFQAVVVGKFDDRRPSAGGAPITFRQERLEQRYERLERVVPRAMHIDIRRHGSQYAFHFVLAGGQPGQRIALQGVARIQAADLEDELSRARDIFDRIATSRQLTSGLDGDPDEFVAQTRSLAQLGEALWTRLFRRDTESSMWAIGEWLATRPLPEGAVVQVSTAPEAQDFIFPWALLFDGTVPTPAYEPPDIDGFWGVRYCIEQRIPTNRLRDPEDGAVSGDPLLLGFFRCQRLKNVALQDALLERLRTEYPGTLTISVPPLEEAERCFRALEVCESDILYFYTHGYTRPRRAAEAGGDERIVKKFVALLREQREREEPGSPVHQRYDELLQEVGDGTYPFDRSWIELTRSRLYLDSLYKRVARLVSRPVVLLNMCESAQATPYLAESFVHFFVDRGARAVLGTESFMSTEFAHPFASTLLARLLEGESIGEALRVSRTDFLQERRNPLGLAYTLYGSGAARVRPERERIQS